MPIILTQFYKLGGGGCVDMNHRIINRKLKPKSESLHTGCFSKLCNVHWNCVTGCHLKLCYKVSLEIVLQGVCWKLCLFIVTAKHSTPCICITGGWDRMNVGSNVKSSNCYLLSCPKKVGVFTYSVFIKLVLRSIGWWRCDLAKEMS